MSNTLVSPTKTNSAPELADRKVLLPWYISEFIYSYSITVFTTCPYFFAKEFLRATPVECLWLSASWGFFYVPFALLSGYMSGKLGQRRWLLRLNSGCVLSALLGLLIIYIPAMQSMWVLFLVMVVMNFTCNQMWPPLESAITRSPAKMALSTRIALYNLTWSSSGFAAIFSAPYINNFGWPAIFIIPSICFLSGLMVLYFLSIPQKYLDQANEVHEAKAEEAVDPEKARRGTALLHMAWLANAMAYVAIFVLIPIWPTIVKIAGVTNSTLSAIFISTWAFARFAGFLITWKWTGWHYSVRWMIGSYVFLALSFAAILCFPAQLFVVLLAEVVFGFMIALLYFSSLYYAMHVSSGDGGHAGIHEALIGLGIGVGPLVGAIAGTGGDVDKIDPKIIVAVLGVLFVGLVCLAIMGIKAGKKPMATETH